MAREDNIAYGLYGVVVIMLAIFALSMSGCATFNRIVTNNELVAQLAVEAATARVIHEHPSWKDATVKITEVVISAIDSKAVVDLASAEVSIKDHIKWSVLVPEEQALVSALISQTVKNLTDSFNARGINDDSSKMVHIRQVLVWWNESAKRQ
jgi:hypothetical protein